MTCLNWAFALVCLWSTPVIAQELLPVALGHHSVALVADANKAPLPTGARVEFTVQDGNGAPRRLQNLSGFVLGTKEGVIFFELSSQNAATLARYRGEGKVSYRKTSDPAPEEVAVRRDYAESGNVITLAPQMRRLTVTMAVDPAIANAWIPGETLTFFGAQKYPRHVKIDGEWVPSVEYRDVRAIFRSANETANGEFEIMVVADPRGARDLLSAELENRLNVDEKTVEATKKAKQNRCYIGHRRGGERVKIEIPCTD